MLGLLQSEWLKFKSSRILKIAILISTFSIFYCILIYAKVMLATNNYIPKQNQWIEYSILSSFFYAGIVLPIILSIISSTLCKLEAEQNKWSYLLSLPLLWRNVFLSKFIILIVISFIIQVISFIIFVIFGRIFLNDSIPWIYFLKILPLSFIGSITLSAIQLWMAVFFNSYIITIIINIFLTLPGPFILSDSNLGNFYPWLAPARGMYGLEGIDYVGFIFINLILSSLILLLGLKYFVKMGAFRLIK